VLVPTRELAIQVDAAIRGYGRHMRVRSAAVYGGVGYRDQLQALSRGLDVLVATPGRLLDLIERGSAKLSGVQYLVLDEADRMLDLGFMPQVRRVLEQGRIPSEGRQTLLFSATMPPQIAQLARDYLNRPTRIDVEATHENAANIEQRLYPVSQSQKAELLVRIVHAEKVDSALIFARTRRRADSLSRTLTRAGLRSEAIHSDVPQKRREQTLSAFRQGRIPFLVATDVASRGLDIPALSHVINHDVPDAAEDYVHRIGRTGRAGRSGVAITLYSRSDEVLWGAVERLTASTLEPTRLAGFRYEADTSEPVLTRRQRAAQQRRTPSPARRRR
jgi:ATP-dependent RNA helicase RhlE